MLATVPIRCRSIGGRIGDLGVALQQDADLALLAHRLLRGGDRARPADGDRQHDPGNSTVLRTGTMISASGRQRRHRGQRRRGAPRVGAALCACELGCRQPRLVPAFCKVMSRQPWASARRTAL